MATRRNLRSNSSLDRNQEAVLRGGKAGLLPRAGEERSVLGNIGNVQDGKCVVQKKPERALIRQKGVSSLEKEVVVRLPPIEQPMEVPWQASGYSALAVEDIDREDKDDPQMVTEVVNDVYAYLRSLERVQEVRQNYLQGVGIAITPKMRSVLIDWLVDVHQQFKLTQETLYLTVSLIDRYLQVEAAKTHKKALQLVGVTAMFIASKYEEMYSPEIRDFVFITDNTYSDAQIRQMEIRMLASIDFELGRPLPLHFLRRNSKAGFVNAKIHTLAKFIMELSLVDYKLAHVFPSMLAAGALAYAMRVLDEDTTLSLKEMWTSTLIHYSSYTLDEIFPLVRELAKLVQKTVSAPKDAKLMQVRKKYAGRKFMTISQHECLNSSRALALAEEEE